MSLSRDERDSAVRKAYEQRNKNSSGVRTLEEIKSEMSYWENEKKNYSDQLFEEQRGFRIFTADKEKVKTLEAGLENARQNYNRVEEEYKNHPDYYEDKYWYDSGFDKAVTGIVNSAVASIPVIGEVLGSELKAHKEYHNDHPTETNYFDVDPNSFAQTESKPQYFDVDPEQMKPEVVLSGLEKYQKPVDMDSKGMKLMEESAWLKNSATEKLSGVGKFLADAAIDVGQNVALLPLLAGGTGTYTAGVAANKAAEDMFEQSAKGKSAGDALTSGLLTAGLKVVNGKISSIDNPWEPVSVKRVFEAVKSGDGTFAKEIIRSAGFEVTQEGVLYLTNFLADKAKRNPNAKFSLDEFLQSAITNKVSGFLDDELEKAWVDFE